MISVLERIWIALQLTLYVTFGVGPILIGCKLIYDSQTKQFVKAYQHEMNLGLGIVVLLVGIIIGWACLVRFVETFRNYKNKN